LFSSLNALKFKKAKILLAFIFFYITLPKKSLEISIETLKLLKLVYDVRIVLLNTL